MPRWPAGLHVASGSQRPTGYRPARWAPRRQESYWRHTTASLWAGLPPVEVNHAGAAATFAGPAGVGETWEVQLVQVQTTSLLARACSAQIWRAVAGVTVDLLFITQAGGYDNVGVPGRPLVPGEQLVVIWEGANPGDMAWAGVQGTKTVLEVMPRGTQA